MVPLCMAAWVAPNATISKCTLTQLDKSFSELTQVSGTMPLSEVISMRFPLARTVQSESILLSTLLLPCPQDVMLMLILV